MQTKISKLLIQKANYKILTTTQIMDESGLHCASTFSPSSSIDSGGLRWLMMGTQGFTYLKNGTRGTRLRPNNLEVKTHVKCNFTEEGWEMKN